MKKILCLLLILPLLGGGRAHALETLRDGDIPVDAPSAILMERETGTVLYEKDADRRMAPASVTKVMTMLLIVEALDAGTLDAFASMEVFMALYEKRLAEGAQKYAKWAHDVSDVPDPENHTMPFMSCFCDCCIDRALDINMGGAKYPSAHGAVLRENAAPDGAGVRGGHTTGNR